ncbi:MAG: 16S rRNA (cytosine(967)-C(5))-methyltransferase RsmB [Thermodesulfobacteriota bacterium]|nr:MAG: 16S rRNA (cytosine(967)-C(5))-methyltransferase RsmB [Thermodesulfobacteriota bacterium]
MDGRGTRKDGSAQKTARKAAFNVLNRVFGAGAYADIVLDREMEGLKPVDRALATEITYGVLRWWMRLDWIIDAFSSIKTKKLETRVLNALRIGTYQILFLTRMPLSAAVNESVKLVKGPDRKKAGFVNAVLRSVAGRVDEVRFPDMEREPVIHLSVFYSHPQWMVRRWVERYGVTGTVELLSANNAAPPRTLRVNTLVTTREGLKGELEDAGFKVRETRYSPLGLTVTGGGGAGYLSPRDKRFYIQDEASQVVPLLLSPSPGERVLDACSAPGGKTTQMAALMENRGIIYAVDRRGGRLKQVKDAAGRFGIKIIKTVEADSSEERFLRPYGDGPFDAVLLDAPCSGLGVLRRSPDIRIRSGEEALEGLRAAQKRLINNVSGYLKKGGRLVYSVCTLEPEETDEVIRWFLAGRKDFALERADTYLTGMLKELVDEEGFLRTLPHRHGTDGFFAARLKKT